MRCLWFALAAFVSVTLMAPAPGTATSVGGDTTVLVTFADLQDPGPAGGASPATGWVKAIGAGQTIGDTPYINYVAGPRLPPAGLQSLHLQTAYDDADPLEKTYVGTNNHAGVRLADITELKYWTFLQSRDYGSSGDPNGQPPMLELITDSGTTNQQRTFVYKPYGQYGNNNVSLLTWQEWDVMAGGRWELLQTSSSNYFGNWSWVVGRYPGLKIAVPLVGDYSTPLAPAPGLQLSNQSGTGLTVKVGSGRALDSRYGAWWRESCGINGYVDKIVIAYNERDDQGNLTGNNIRVTYDFDDVMLPAVATSNRNAATDVAIGAAGGTRMFVVFGKVLASDYAANEYFTIDDGSGRPIRVYAKNHTITQPTEFDSFYVRAKGRMVNGSATPVLWSSADLIEMIPQ